jgi:transposase
VTASSTQLVAPLFVGIDVAKAKFDYSSSADSRVVTLKYDDRGVRQIVQQLLQLKPALIVMESTGGYERKLAAAFLDANLPVAVANPRNVRHFAIGMGILAKSDPIDTGALVLYAQHVQPRLLQKRPENQLELDAIVARRRQLLDTRTMESNRLDQTTSKLARQSIKTVLGTLNKQIDQLDKSIVQLIKDDDDLAGKSRIIQSVPGVGPVVSATLIAQTPELGRINRNEISALVGVAPYDHDSGTFKGKRSIFGGRAAVRAVLYMAAITAKRCNPVIRAFAERLELAGKPFKVVIVACMRKLLTIINALVKRNELWNPQKLALNA